MGDFKKMFSQKVTKQIFKYLKYFLIIVTMVRKHVAGRVRPIIGKSKYTLLAISQ